MRPGRTNLRMPPYDKTAAIDHVVVLMFENRSFDNLLGRLYGAGRPVSRWRHGRAMGAYRRRCNVACNVAL